VSSELLYLCQFLEVAFVYKQDVMNALMQTSSIKGFLSEYFKFYSFLTWSFHAPEPKQKIAKQPDIDSFYLRNNREK